MLVQICVGSSCHLKGSERLVELFSDAIAKNKIDGEVTLAGSFCTGQCNREGVTVTIDDTVYTGITPEKFDDFFKEKILSPVLKSKGMQTV